MERQIATAIIFIIAFTLAVRMINRHLVKRDRQRNYDRIAQGAARRRGEA